MKVEEYIKRYGLETEDSLEHYGVLGMKWGKSGARGVGGESSKKKKGSSKGKGSSDDEKKSDTSEDHKTKVKLKSKKISEMSNKEIETLNKRMNLEKSYKDLTAAKKSKGRKLFEELVVSSAKETAKAYITKQMKSAVGIKGKADVPKVKLKSPTKLNKAKLKGGKPKEEKSKAETLDDKVKEEDIPKKFR